MPTIRAEISLDLDSEAYKEMVDCGRSPEDIIAKGEEELLGEYFYLVKDVTFAEEKIIE